MQKILARCSIFAFALSAAVAANAAAITGYVYLNGPVNEATIAARPSTPADATFNFNGTANFTDAPGNDSTTTTIDQFLASGGVAPLGGTVGSSILNNTYFFFTGSVGLKKGANVFTVTHDDGLQLNIDGIGLVVDQPGPTAPTPTTYTVNAPSAGYYNFELSYGECCGGPAQITVFGGSLQVPEASTLAGLGVGMGLLGFAAIRRRRA